ncbi:hypothetical protein HHK36_006004 [Tetracentron sinense]|uniref:Protein kinase domain-containing protein n=1 Tax=Tetracentron sinense TaxID=13715 RepID=A0A834ZKH2_TETSI|nr:hypothetical protein HHK36_006004 [Tetracentron sinense]
MEKLFSLFLLIFSLFSLSLSISTSDSDTLLAFKSSSDHSNSLSSWSNSSNPCSGSWLGVTCNNRTHRVTRLVLQNLNLNGSIQTLISLTHLRLLSLKNNTLSSSLDFSSWKNLKLLFLSHNQFSGNFPAGISHLRRLRRLDLSHNRLSGHIPMSVLNKLPHLLTLRLEANSFTGTLSSLDSISDFNVSENNLSGEIPTSFSSFKASSFMGNRNLCGKPLLNKCLNLRVQSNPTPIGVSGHGRKKLSDLVVLMIVVIDIFVVVAMIVFFVYCYKQKSREKKREVKRRISYEREDEEMVCFEGCVRYRVDDLLKASAEMLGKGSVGTTYKVVMDDGGDVAVVKRVREMRKKKEVEGFLKEIGGLRHGNIISYFKVVNFTGNRGPGRTPLDWTARLKLASGAAKGLAFLHGAGKSKLSHGHLTSSNIIVNQSGDACISDVGLHQLFLATCSSNNEYNAPELMLNTHNPRNFSHKSDVYSFGVILLEILTGKMATGEGVSLAKWVQRVVREEWTAEVFDIELLRYKEMEEEMVGLLQVALLCLAPMAGDRPKMSVVHKMIEDIRERGASRGGGLHSPNDLSSSSDSSPSLSSRATPNFTSS